MKRIIIIVGILIVAVVTYFYMFKTKKSDKIEYTYFEIRKGTIQREVTASGTLNVTQTVDVGTQVSGIVSKIFVDFNDVVKEGQLIAMIDTVALVTNVVDAEANMLKAKSQLTQQKKEFERYTDLLASKAISQSDFDQVNSNYLVALSSLKSAEAQLTRAKTNLKFATITAPISGVVISRSVNVGQTVAASFSTPTLVTIAKDLTKMQLQAKIDEGDIGLIKKEQKVAFTIEAYPDLIFNGTVEQIRLQPTTSQNVVTYTVIIDAPNPDLKLLPGMSAKISIIVDEHKDVFMVPISAIFFSPSQDQLKTINQNEVTIWVQSKDKIANSKEFNGVNLFPIVLQKGIDDGTFIEISGDNIQEGMKIIIGEKDIVKTTTKSGLLGPPKNMKKSPMMQ